MYGVRGIIPAYSAINMKFKVSLFKCGQFQAGLIRGARAVKRAIGGSSRRSQ
jgi:hypothetical protein